LKEEQIQGENKSLGRNFIQGSYKGGVDASDQQRAFTPGGERAHFFE